MILGKKIVILGKYTTIIGKIVQFLVKLGKLTFYIGIFLLIGKFPGQLGIFSANWEKIWYRKPDPVLYREKVGHYPQMAVS